MRFPAYVLLPILGAVALVAAVLGSWLWPAPTVPSSSIAPPPMVMPVAVATPEPPPPAVPAPPRPAPRPVAVKPPPPPVEPPPSIPVMPASEPVAVVNVPPPMQLTDMSPEARGELKKKWSSLRNRAAELAMKGVEQLERQREEARARGDQAEFERLDTAIRTHKERVELMRGARPELPATGPGPGLAPPVQAGPAVQ
ncbi:hypothetical protein [Hyalangium gracile]|uniref:hypothetical protein n=1 Tax=Hyalangium gracile TaxID=394092 RepID=UPI001CCCDD67|nr:hypothetical protein [Hyalangium gracile]